MWGKTSRLASAAVVAALMMSGTAKAAAPASVAPATQAAPNGWLALSMLTPAGTLGLASVTAQPVAAATDAPPPPPAPPPAYGSVPPIPVITIWLATVAMAVYILSRDHNGHFFFPKPPPVSAT